MTISFMINMVNSNPSIDQMARGAFIPTIPSDSTSAALGLVGAIIMPHNLYLHSSLVLTRKIDYPNLNKVRDAIVYNNIESGFSLFISFIVSMMVITTFAAYTQLDGST